MRVFVYIAIIGKSVVRAGDKSSRMEILVAIVEFHYSYGSNILYIWVGHV